MDREYITCAALHYSNGKTYVHQPENIQTGFVVTGHRHHNCYVTLEMIDPNHDHNRITQGFLTSGNRFVDRKEGFKIARCASQLRMRIDDWNENTILTSEEIY